MQHFLPTRRMRREAKTVELMIRRYCADHHQTDKQLCHECTALLAYASKRLQHCPFQSKKTTCGRCKIHCYSPGMRERIRQVMRYSGPRMLWSNPVLAAFHLLDGLRKTPPAD